jgi:prepilin-type N-terminal cleavage/methylation domain-containing protein
METMVRVYRDEGGFTLLEMLTTLVVVALLVAVAVPAYLGFQARARETGARGELRTMLLPVKAHLWEHGDLDDIEAAISDASPGVRLDTTAVAGVRLTSSTDGAVCLFRQPSEGVVLVVREPRDPDVFPTLYARLDALPDACPTYDDAVASGYASTGW